jgi:DNA-binding response OmpR family regulator
MFLAMSKVLLIEDDLDLVSRISKWLALERYSVETVANGQEALDLLRDVKYDFIILDWHLPGLAGIEVCKYFRSSGGTTPILMLTGKSDIADKEAGLDAGADDYLIKPFHPRELSARLRALGRRPTECLDDQLRAGNLVLQIHKYRLIKNGQEVELLPLEFSLLEFFMRHPGRVFGADALIERVWPVNSEASPEAVRTCIKTLRKKIDTEGELSLIKTVHGVGYKFEPPTVAKSEPE